MNETKLYELIIPPDMDPIILSFHYENNDYKIECITNTKENWYSSYINKSNCPHLISTNEEIVFCIHGDYLIHDLVYDINDNPISLQNYVLNICKNKHYKMLTIIHRKHPKKQNIRQVGWFIAKTDRPVHWID